MKKENEGCEKETYTPEEAKLPVNRLLLFYLLFHFL